MIDLPTFRFAVLHAPIFAVAVALGACLVSCRGNTPAPRGSTAESAGEVQAVIELGDSGGMPFLAEHGVMAALFPSPGGGELVIHAGSDLDRIALALVFDLADPNLPGVVDLARHSVVLMELDRVGGPELVLDGVPQGSAEIHGRIEPGQEISGSFNLALPGTDELDTPLTARIDGTFAVVLSPLPGPTF